MTIIENEVDDMIPIIFSNKSNLPINISIAGIQDTYDLFCFCLDIFIKGIIYLHGNGESKLNILSLSMMDLKNVTDKMKKTGIEVSIEVITMNIRLMNAVSIPPKNDTKTNLDEYVLEIIIDQLLYKITFSCIRFIST